MKTHNQQKKSLQTIIIAMHRICGWALKSASDNLKARMKDAEQKKPANPQLLNSMKKQFESATSLKVPNSDKHLLPKRLSIIWTEEALHFLNLHSGHG